MDMYMYYGQKKPWDECVRELFSTKHFSDVTFVVEYHDESVTIPAHKLILSMSSPKFAEMFYGPKAAVTNHLILRNVRPDVVGLLLRHIYLKEEVHFRSLEQCFDILPLATTYELSSLRRSCTNYIEGCIDVEQVCSVYQASLAVRNRNLVLKSLQFIQKETKYVLEGNSWRSALPNTVKSIVEQKYLNIDSEIQLFEAVVSWAESRLRMEGMTPSTEKLRQQIEPFLPNIRFSSMKVKTFLLAAHKTQIFSNDEITAICFSYVGKDESSLPPWFNSCANCRTYEYRNAANDIYRDNWFNINKNVYSHSERTEKISSTFKAKHHNFSIHQLLIAICDDCFAHNIRSKRMFIDVNVTIKSNSAARETRLVLPMECHGPIRHYQSPDFDSKQGLLLSRGLRDNLVSAKGIGMRAHSTVIEAFLDPDFPHFSQVVESYPTTLTKVIDLDPPVLISSEERFEILMETSNKTEPFFCCKKKPSFEGVPFTSCTIATDANTDEEPEVWCAFASLGYSMPKEEIGLCD